MTTPLRCVMCHRACRSDLCGACRHKVTARKRLDARPPGDVVKVKLSWAERYPGLPRPTFTRWSQLPDEPLGQPSCKQCPTRLAIPGPSGLCRRCRGEKP